MEEATREARPPLQWSEVKVFVDETGQSDVAVRLARGDGQGRPQFSLEIGKCRDGKFLRHQRVQYTTDNGVVTVRAFDVETLARLVAGAEAMAQEVLQTREDEFQVRQASRMRPEPRPARSDHMREGLGRDEKGRRRRGTHGRYDGDDRY
jgi:hypothetical protein